MLNYITIYCIFVVHLYGQKHLINMEIVYQIYFYNSIFFIVLFCILEKYISVCSAHFQHFASRFVKQRT